MEILSMVEQDFTYNGVDYIGYETRSMYWMVNYPYEVQFFAYRTLQEVDTIYIDIDGTETNRDVVINGAIAILTNG